jgi:hypothetical protein
MKQAIINLINKWACMHDWDKFDEINVYTTHPEKAPVLSTILMLVCKKCGKIKQINL